MIDVAIAPESGKKGRTFKATCLAHVFANGLYANGAVDNNVKRPVWAVFCGTKAEMQAFGANLQLGREALSSGLSGGHRDHKAGFAFLKSAGYRQAWQHDVDTNDNAVSILTVYLPSLFLADPGMVDPKVVKFILLPPASWAAEQEIDREAIVAHVRKLPSVKKINRPPRDARGWRDPSEKHKPALPDDKIRSLVDVAHLFAAVLDKRTRAPIPADGRFYTALLIACLREGVASLPCRDLSPYAHHDFGESTGLAFQVHGLKNAGILPQSIAFCADHERIESIMAECAEEYFDCLPKGER